MAGLIKLADMAGVMHEAIHTYSTLLAADVPFIARVINSPSTSACYLDLSNFHLEPELLYFKVLSICLLLVCFVSAAGFHCFDFDRRSHPIIFGSKH